MVPLFVKKAVAKIPVNTYELCSAFSLMEQNFKDASASPYCCGRQDLWDKLFCEIGAETPLILFEFGVYKGKSIQYFASKNHNRQSKFIGFDSFEGLPEDWRSANRKEHFSTHGVMPEKQDDRIEFVKGWFSDTVIREISKYKNTNGRQVVCHFDADLYSSTLFCLTAVLQKFKTFYFIFDEFYRDEVRALHNAKQAYPCEIRFIAHTKHARGQYPSRVAGLVENLTKF